MLWRIRQLLGLPVPIEKFMNKEFSVDRKLVEHLQEYSYEESVEIKKRKQHSTNLRKIHLLLRSGDGKKRKRLVNNQYKNVIMYERETRNIIKDTEKCVELSKKIIAQEKKEVTYDIRLVLVCFEEFLANLKRVNINSTHAKEIGRLLINVEKAFDVVIHHITKNFSFSSSSGLPETIAKRLEAKRRVQGKITYIRYSLKKLEGLINDENVLEIVKSFSEHFLHLADFVDFRVQIGLLTIKEAIELEKEKKLELEELKKDIREIYNIIFSNDNWIGTQKRLEKFRKKFSEDSHEVEETFDSFKNILTNNPIEELVGNIGEMARNEKISRRVFMKKFAGVMGAVLLGGAVIEGCSTLGRLANSQHTPQQEGQVERSSYTSEAKSSSTNWITIDDGPSNNLAKFLDILKRYKIRAVFFFQGVNLKRKVKHPAVIRVVREGHIIGNHSYSHPNFKKISWKKAEKELDDTEELIDSVYAQAKIERRYKFFRFPYGSKKYESEIKEKGFEVWGWNRDSLDWKFQDSSSTQTVGVDVNAVLENTAPKNRKDGLIVLIHENKDTVDNYLIKIIEQYKSKNISLNYL